MKQTVIKNFDDFTEEVGCMPDLTRQPVFQLTPLEAHLFDIAEKHGVIDQMIDQQWEEDY